MVLFSIYLSLFRHSLFSFPMLNLSKRGEGGPFSLGAPPTFPSCGRERSILGKWRGQRAKLTRGIRLAFVTIHKALIKLELYNSFLIFFSYMLVKVRHLCVCCFPLRNRFPSYAPIISCETNRLVFQ